MNKLIEGLMIVCLAILYKYSSPQSFTVFISGKMDSINYGAAVSIEKYGIRGHLKFDPDNSMPVQKDGQFSGTIPISGKGFYKIGDLFVGHKIFLRPGDSISILLTKRVSKEDRKRFSTGYSMKVKSKFPKNISFFDEIAEEHPLPTYDTSFQSPMDFKEVLTKDFHQKVALLKKYENEKLVSEDFVPFAIIELESIYIREWASLIAALSRQSLGKEYFDLPFQIDLSDSTMAVSTQFLGSAAYIYDIYVLNKYDENRFFENLEAKYESVISYYKGFVRDYLLGRYLEDFAGHNVSDFDSVYNTFLQVCKNDEIKNATIRKVSAILSKENKHPAFSENADISFSDAMEKSLVEDAAGNQLPLKNILSGNKTTIIDSWATWCYPCLYQYPFMKKIELRYKDSVNFVYLSFDKNREDWKKYLEKNRPNSQNEFRLLKEFDSPITKYLKIEKIPRYIFISPGGDKLINDDMPSPLKVDEFTKIISDVL